MKPFSYKNKKNNTAFNLSASFVLGITIVLGTFWLVGEPDRFFLMPKLRQYLQLPNVNIDISPYGSEVFIDGAYAGITPLWLYLEKGSHTITVKNNNNNYQAFNSTIFFSGETFKLTSHLKRNIELVMVADSAAKPFFDFNNKLIYIDTKTMWFIKYENPDDRIDIAPLPNNFTSLSYSPKGDYVLIYDNTEYYEELVLLSLKDQSIKELPYIGLPYWVENDSSFLVFSPADNGQETLLRVSGLDLRSPKKVFDGNTSINGYAISANYDGSLITIQSDQSLDVWQTENKSIVKQVPNGYGAFWAKTSPPKLFFHDGNNELCWTGQFLDWKDKCANGVISYPVNLAGNENLVFTVIDTNGRISFWKFDVNSDSKILLASNLTGIGKVQELVMSSDEGKIAIVNSYGNLFLLVLK